MEHERQVLLEALAKALLPAHPLVLQGPQVLGGLGPAHRIREEGDAVGNTREAQGPVQTDDELHVLADRVGTVAARLDHPLLVEQAEGARDDQQGIQRSPAEPPEEERAQVLDDLEQGQGVGRKARLHEETTLHLATVRDADRAARRDRRRVLEEGLHRFSQAVSLKDGVRVHRAEERVAGPVDAGVQGIRLAAILLVDDPEVGVGPGVVDPADRSGS
ncbi:hypothetical protein D3C86_1582040 [compost metagenome]